jgi:hypothetical protein
VFAVGSTSIGVIACACDDPDAAAPHSIRVNSLHPAGVNTPMIDNDFIRSWLSGLAQETQVGPDMGNALPVQTLEPDDIANGVVGSKSTSVPSFDGRGLTQPNAHRSYEGSVVLLLPVMGGSGPRTSAVAFIAEPDMPLLSI